jgi:hypothetical protein
MSGLRWSPEQHEAWQARRGGAATPAPKMPAPRKYRNQVFEADGQRWDSKKEYRHWCHLRQLELNGNIRELRRQVAFRLEVNGQLICEYLADFTYVRGLHEGVDPRLCVIDAKSKPTRTPAYRLKAKLMRAIHGIEITEV